jgi:lipopolysaccharide export system protein LptA
MRMTITRPRFTIERLRTLLLIGGGLLIAAILIFLAAGQWTRRFLSKDLPHRLGVNIEQQADGVNYTQTRKGKTIFKIHAARAVTMKNNGKTLLHDVKIDLYGEDGTRADTISGSEFEYDQNAGVATAAGAVEITMMRPGVKPAISQLRPGSAKPNSANGAKPAGSGAASTPAGNTAGAITDDQIHVKTSGLVFRQKDGVATTTQRVDFALKQGNGNSIGATYDSQNGQLILDRAVELHVQRGNAQTSGPVTVHAAHAEFQHDDMVCEMTQAKADYTGGTAATAHALIHFREDGSVIRVDGSDGVDLQTKTGGHVTAPVGDLEFDQNNHPQHGLLQGGANLEMNQANRQIQGSSPTAQLTFDKAGELSLAHMEQGVTFNSQQQVTTAKGTAAQIHRTWKSKTADVAFAPVASSTSGSKSGVQGSGKAQTKQQEQGHVEPRTIHGFGGVVVTSETSSDGVVTPSKLSADTVVAELAPGEVLSSLVGTGHANFEERTTAGVHQATSSDQLDVRFYPEQKSEKGATESAAVHAKESASKASISKGSADGSNIASIVQIGHVVLVQDPPPARPSAQGAMNGNTANVQQGLRATADRSDYDGESRILHLTGSPRVRDGALDMTASRIDFNRATQDAFAHGDVRASWVGSGTQASGSSSESLPGASLLGGAGAGGNGPAHAIAAEAELHQATQEVVFRGASSGSQPRLWQAGNSVSAPVILLNRQKQTLDAQSSGAANPVRTVLVSNVPAPAATSSASTGGAARPDQIGSESGKAESGKSGAKKKSDSPSIIRVRSGDLHYSEAERLALFHSGPVGTVTAETTGTGGTATVLSQEAEVKLMPAGTHAGANPSPSGNKTASANSSANSPPNSSIDRLTAKGHVVVDWPDRRGTGERLVYLNEDDTFTLTGTSSAPPRITDESRGTVTGSTLVYHSRDDSVTVEGDGGKTETDTRSKK